MKKFLIAILFHFYLTLNIYPTETIKGGCESNYPPYNFYDNDNLIGIDSEIINLVFKKMGVNFAIETYPWQRVLFLLQNEKLDFAWQFVETPERKKEFNLAGPIRIGETVFFVSADSKIKSWKNLSEFNNLVIGTVRGYKYSTEFDNNKNFKREISNDNQNLSLKTIGKRVDISVGDKNSILYILKKTNNLNKIIFLKKPLSLEPRYVAFSKKNVQLSKNFQTTLNQIINKKEYNNIINKYIK
ncbi:substrate-binding periplasmic protein [Silvanigrella aquatica]|uniref:Solute-binding protein family 3/N-terminal domain-containing protein n=1 Tax=Silvanigrella aquatica TaxID=1915309 RepID=A0A1L4CZ20_9BACT|nr:transporter substrate-binding domain-containing protein [Silvanigrella aquatica]APJ03180.1 hypothetical protein AXG55_04385 [Silvanigrella aquatica]